MEELKIRIFQPNVRQYRVSLFEGVGQRYDGCVELCASDELWEGGHSSPVQNVKMDYAHSNVKIGPFTWQKGFSLRGLVPKRDVVVICGDVKNLAMMWIAAKARFLRIAVVWWGHHKTAGARDWRVSVRVWVMKHLARTILFYTKRGIKWYGARGNGVEHVFATENALDLKPMVQASEKWTANRISRFLEERGLKDKAIYLFCSRLMQKVKLDLAIRAFSRVAHSTSEKAIFVIIGDGPELDRYKRLAEELKVGNQMKWLGAMFSQDEMAPWFLSAKALVYPGAIGLSIFHAFSYGLPVITHGNADNQMPEFAAMIDGQTGLLFNEDDDVDLANKMCLIVADENRRRNMAAFARQHVFSKYTMESMVDNFCRAIEDARGN